jgi:uncharacterized membrane protein
VTAHIKKYLGRAGWVLAILVAIIGSLYFANLALFNAWLTAFEKYQHALSQLKFRFWSFSFLSVVSLALMVFLIVTFIKSIRKNKKQGREP